MKKYKNIPLLLVAILVVFLMAPQAFADNPRGVPTTNELFVGGPTDGPGNFTMTDDGYQGYFKNELEVDGTGYFDGAVTVTGTLTATTTRNISFPLTGILIDTDDQITTTGISTAPGLELDDVKVKLVWADGELTKKQVTFHIPDDYSSGGNFELFCTRSGTGDPPSVDFEQLVALNLTAAPTAVEAQDAVELDINYTSSPQQVTLTPAAQTYAAGMRVTFNYWRDNTDTSGDDLEVENAIFTYTARQ